MLGKFHLLLSCVCCSLFGMAQSSIGTKVTLLSNPKKQHYTIAGENVTRLPMMLRAELGYNLNFGQVHLHIGIPIMYTQLSYDLLFFDGVNDFEKRRVTHDYVYTGVQVGAGYELKLGRFSKLLLPINAELFTTDLSRTYGEGLEGNNLFGKRAFEETLGYGLNFQPEYEFSFSRKKLSPWRFSLHATLLCMQSELSGNKPVLVVGGGVGVCYIVQR